MRPRQGRILWRGNGEFARRRDMLRQIARQQAPGRHADAPDDQAHARQHAVKTGRAPGRERVCQYVYISGVAGALKKKQIQSSSSTLKARKTVSLKHQTKT